MNVRALRRTSLALLLALGTVLVACGDTDEATGDPTFLNGPGPDTSLDRPPFDLQVPRTLHLRDPLTLFISEPGGIALEGAEVALDLATGERMNAVTDAEGEVTFLGVGASAYPVTVSAHRDGLALGVRTRSPASCTALARTPHGASCWRAGRASSRCRWRRARGRRAGA